MRAPRGPRGASPPNRAPDRSAGGRGVRFVSLLPRLTPATDLGAAAVAAYAERQGVDVGAFIRASGPALRADQVGRAVLEIAGANTGTQDAYLLTSAGLSSLARSA